MIQIRNVSLEDAKRLLDIYTYYVEVKNCLTWGQFWYRDPNGVERQQPRVKRSKAKFLLKTSMTARFIFNQKKRRR